MNKATCHQWDHIAQYVLGTLDEQEMEQVAGHLESCPRCRGIADELESASDPLIEIIGSPQPAPPYVGEPQCQRVMDRTTTLPCKSPWLFQPGGVEDPCDGESALPRAEEPSRPEVSNSVPQRSTRWFWELLALAGGVSLLVFGGRMMVDWLEPAEKRGAPRVVARRNPLLTDGQSKHTPEAAPQETVEESTLGGSATQPPPTTPAPAKDRKASGQEASVPTATGSSEDHPANGPDTPPAFAVRVELDRSDGIYRGPPAGPDGKGESIHIKVVSDQPGYLYLLGEQADGTLLCFFPNVFEADNEIEAGQPVTVPDPQGDFELRAGTPYGTEVLVALVSLKPLEPRKFSVASLTDQQSTVVDRDAVERLRAEIRRTPDTGAEVQVKFTTRPGDQQKSQAPESASPLPKEAPEFMATPTDEAPGVVRGGNQEQLDHHASKPSLLASRHQSDQPAPSGGRCGAQDSGQSTYATMPHSPV